MEQSILIEETVSSRLVYRGRVFDVRSDRVRLAGGHESTREYIATRGAVAVVALDREGRVAMERQYRHAQGRVVYEIPAGKLEAGEEPLAAAKRELLEETGVTAAEYIPLGVYVPSPAIVKEDIYLYLARGLSCGEAHLDEGELLTVEFRPMEELIDMIMRDEIRDGKTVFALAKAKLYLEGRRG